jgi:hypothetical protein
MSTQEALALPSPAPLNTVVINARCSLRIEADQRVIVVGGLPVHHYRAEDAIAETNAMVFLVESGFAQQMEVARAFTRSVRSLRRYQAARADLAKLEREYGAAAAANCEQRRPTIRGFKIAHGKLGKQLRTARARVAKMSAQRQDLPKRIEVRDLNERAVVKLATERKHLTDIIKMVAYQAESDLLALLRPHYARADQEGRTLLHELFATAGDIRVGDSELHITLAPLSLAASNARRPGTV